MNAKIAERYDLAAAVRSIPKDRAELFTGFQPWRADLEEFERSSSKRTERDGLVGSRTVWDHAKRDGRRVLIEIDERGDAGQAIEALAERLENNQLAKLDAGPPDLGLVAFKHPEGIPPAVFFVRGNLSIFVASFGSRPVEAEKIAARVSKRLGERPEVARDEIKLIQEGEPAKARAPLAVRYQHQWRIGEDGFVAVDVSGGTARLAGPARIEVAPAGPELKLAIFALEPEREPYFGRLTLKP